MKCVDASHLEVTNHWSEIGGWAMKYGGRTRPGLACLGYSHNAECTAQSSLLQDTESSELFHFCHMKAQMLLCLSGVVRLEAG